MRLSGHQRSLDWIPREVERAGKTWPKKVQERRRRQSQRNPRDGRCIAVGVSSLISQTGKREPEREGLVQSHMLSWYGNVQSLGGSSDLLNPSGQPQT